MGAKKILLVCAALFAVQSYWLYCPVPDGYSPQSTRKLRFFLATIKVTDFLVGTRIAALTPFNYFENCETFARRVYTKLVERQLLVQHVT